MSTTTEGVSAMSATIEAPGTPEVQEPLRGRVMSREERLADIDGQIASVDSDRQSASGAEKGALTRRLNRLREQREDVVTAPESAFETPEPDEDAPDLSDVPEPEPAAPSKTALRKAERKATLQRELAVLLAVPADAKFPADVEQVTGASVKRLRDRSHLATVQGRIESALDKLR